VEKRAAHFKHSLLLRVVFPSLVSRESTTFVSELLQKGQFIFLCLKNFSSSKISKFDKYRLFIQHIVYLERIIAQEKKLPSL